MKIAPILLTAFLSVSALHAEFYINVDKEAPKKVEYKVPDFLKGMDLAEAFFRQLPEGMNKDQIVDMMTMVKNDRDFEMGNKVLYNDRYKLKKKNVYDQEFPGAPQTILMPNYPKALEYFTKSVQKNKNPIAAYEGIMIINTYLGKNYKNNKKLLKIFEDVLFKAGTCEGYLARGKRLLYGYDNTPVQLDAAAKIFQKGLKKCQNVNYYGTVMSSKLLTVESYKRKNKSLKERGASHKVKR